MTTITTDPKRLQNLTKWTVTGLIYFAMLSLASAAPPDNRPGGGRPGGGSGGGNNGEQFTITPSDDAAAIVNNAPAGSTFTFVVDATGGVHRPLQFNLNHATDTWLIPKDNQTFVCESGVSLNGAQVLVGDWVADGGLFRYDGAAPPKYSIDCSPAACMMPGREVNDIPEDLYIDNERYLRVDSLDKVHATPGVFDNNVLWAGTFFQNGGSGAIYVANEPATGALVELTRKAFAFRSAPSGNAANPEYVSNVTIDNCIIEKFASPAQLGAIEALFTRDWTLRNVKAINNHGAGARLGESTVIAGGVYSENGQAGIIASSGPAADWGGAQQYLPLSSNLEISNATVAYNNWAGYNCTWEAGGIKVLLTDGLVVENTHIHHNLCNGLWTDTDVTGTRIVDNLVENNLRIGVLIESADACEWLSTSASCRYRKNLRKSSFRTEIISNNTVRNNARAVPPSLGSVFVSEQSGGSLEPTWWWGSEILLQNSSGFVIENNSVTVSSAQGIGVIEQGNGDRGHGPRNSHNNLVRNNTVEIAVEPTANWWDGYSGADQDTGSPIAAFNIFEYNNYVTGSGIDASLGYWRFDTFSAYTWDALPIEYDRCSTLNGADPKDDGSC